MIEYNDYKVWIATIDDLYAELDNCNVFNDGTRVWVTVDGKDVAMWSIVGKYGWVK